MVPWSYQTKGLSFDSDSLLSIHLSALCLPSPVHPKYLPAGGPPVIVFPRCLNREMLTDETDFSRDECSYGWSKTDVRTDRCHGGHLQELGSGAVDRWVIIIPVLHLLIRASLTLSLSLIPLSFPSPQRDKLMCWMKTVRMRMIIMRTWREKKNKKGIHVLEMTKCTVISI